MFVAGSKIDIVLLRLVWNGCSCVVNSAIRSIVVKIEN